MLALVWVVVCFLIFVLLWGIAHWHRNYCETIMDDLLLFTPKKKTHMAKLGNLLKTFLKNGLKGNVNFLESIAV